MRRLGGLVAVGIALALAGCAAPAEPEAGEQEEPAEAASCEQASDVYLQTLNENLRRGVEISSLMVAQSEEYPGGESPLFTGRSVWFVAAPAIDGEVPAWATGNDPLDPAGQEGLTVPVSPAARKASTLGVDVSADVIDPLLSDPALTTVLACAREA